MTTILFLAACGFHPIYGSRGGDGSPVAAELNQVAIDNIPDRQGQMLRNELIDRMYGKGRPSQPAYRLSVKVHVSEEDIATTEQATSIRSMLNSYGDYILFDAKGKQLLGGTAHSVSSYNTLNDQYGNMAAHDSAVERTVSEIGEQIVNRLSLYFAEKDQSNSPNPSSSDGK